MDQLYEKFMAHNNLKKKLAIEINLQASHGTLENSYLDISYKDSEIPNEYSKETVNATKNKINYVCCA